LDIYGSRILKVLAEIAESITFNRHCAHSYTHGPSSGKLSDRGGHPSKLIVQCEDLDSRSGRPILHRPSIALSMPKPI
jgi:hypothetical protein